MPIDVNLLHISQNRLKQPLKSVYWYHIKTNECSINKYLLLSYFSSYLIIIIIAVVAAFATAFCCCCWLFVVNLCYFSFCIFSLQKNEITLLLNVYIMIKWVSPPEQEFLIRYHLIQHSPFCETIDLNSDIFHVNTMV